MSQDTGTTSKLRPVLIVGSVVAIAVTGFFVSRQFLQDEEVPEIPPQEIEVDLARVAELRNLGVAWVENLEYDKAADAFSELATLLPDEKLPWQNLAITKLLKADPETTKPGTPEFSQVIVEAKTAIDDYAERYPEELLSQLLRARYFLRLLPTADFENAGRGLVRAYRNAIQMQPEQAFLHYQFYDAVNLVRDTALSDEAFQSLQRAWKLDADNLHLMREMFRAQTRPDRNDPEVAQTFAAATSLIGPYVQKIRNFSPIDPEALLKTGIAAAGAKDWPRARSCALQIGNVLAPEVASQKDKKSVEPHLLEFLAFNFSPETSRKLEAFRRNFPPAIPVKFVSATDDLAIPGSPVAVSTGDFDLDGRLEIVAVFENRVEVWQHGETAWETLTALDVDAGLTGVSVVGLDRDAVKLEHAWDADVDLIAYGAGGVTLIENSLNTETGLRSLVRRDAGEELGALRNVLAVLPVDYDHDGDLDLIISTDKGLSMWLNIADWKFIDHSQYSQLPPTDAKIHSMTAVDWDRDVAIDVLCFGEGIAGRLGNVLHGRLRWQTFPPEAAYLKNVNSCSVLESDANFSWDILAAGDDGISVARTTNPDAGVVTFTGRASVSEAPARGATTWDFDTDGFLDVAAWQGADLRAVRGDRKSTR
ncbi:MAG: FG-GAP-like repeat-containing protein, partial [Planctomycetaceae bacterium]